MNIQICLISQEKHLDTRCLLLHSEVQPQCLCAGGDWNINILYLTSSNDSCLESFVIPNNPPWCSGSAGCRAPAEKTADLFQASWHRSSAR